MKKVVIFARVSTAVQGCNRQLVELREFAQRMGYEVVREFEETISGAMKIAEREVLRELLAYVKEHQVDKILIYECSRLSRNVVDFISIVEIFNACKVSVYFHQNGMETLQPDGTPNPISQLVLGMLAQFNSMERSLIRSRMESGYNHYRARGGAVGRKAGYRKSAEQMKEQYKEEIKLLRKGYSLRNISAITNTSVNTLRKLKAEVMA